MTTTTPAEKLTAAADLLDALIAGATPGNWTATDQYPHLVMQGAGNDEDLRIVSTNLAGYPQADAGYIAAMGPSAGRAVVTLLRNAGLTLPLGDMIDPAMLDLARAILASKEANR